MEQLINSLKNALEGALPGMDAQYRMAPQHRQRIALEKLKAESYRPSAVMILFCEDGSGTTFLPLTERMTYNGAHSGQVSLPGGKFEDADGDLMRTAIRECYEEIGIREVEVIGRLTPLFIPVSGFMVHPYIGFCKVKDPVMKNQEREVKTLIRLRLEDLLNDTIVKEGEMQVAGSLNIKTPWFEVEGLRVWGATAMILSELKELIKTIA